MSLTKKLFCLFAGIIPVLCQAQDGGAGQAAVLERAGFICAGGYCENQKFILVDQLGLENFGLMHNSDFYIGPGTAVMALPDQQVPAELSLEQNFPNPFNQSTVFRCALPKTGKIYMDIYSLLGQHVSTLFAGERPPGFYQILFNGTDDNGRLLASGTYFCRLVVADEIRIVKFSIIR